MTGPAVTRRPLPSLRSGQALNQEGSFCASRALIDSAASKHALGVVHVPGISQFSTCRHTVKVDYFRVADDAGIGRLGGESPIVWPEENV